MQIAATFLENPDPASWHGRKVAYRFAPAVDGYRTLLTASASLSASDRGFREWFEIATASAPHISKEQVSMIRLAGLDVTPSGNGIYLECRDSEGKSLYSTSILNPMTEMEKRFYDRPLRQARSLLFWGGLALSAVMYVLEVRERPSRSSQSS
jgi:acyl-CoA thioesterase